ncbi:Uncharacterized conserved protein YlxW, UPF0749 family [Halobacillus karajensis]|uniref:Division initiation protein n=1 Tax=Halobacillus karajensis TaxID=195088 RepID=A0A024P2L1_9BACI|nr:DUF881 domain-containing protein [Halobacillus karajensis]CDQ19838.1 hypothetical protein BN982_02144 [Halobacillus karajensis]CDQ22298.1 hypothetical protein BN983_00505 [Halobacillus karajensis]CDQ28139.1 hypothetical protein BN981_02432 [Halobacillus karajensis]SEH71306.1 Uncharacterized conserved protein YlxW, UPF0749 family [Halobacillus karajensis]
MKRRKGKSIILSLVLLVSGFLVSYSYQLTKSSPEMIQLNDSQWEKEYFYQQQLLDMEKKNKQLREELKEKRKNIQDIENEMADREQVVADFVERKKKLQMLNGEVPIQGEGVEIVLRDAEYIPDEEQVNQYIVHESHIHSVVNELLSAGAKAVAINGQRYMKDSYIACTGPVITVDGVQHPAPFVITAIGDAEVLYSSLNLTQGVVDQLRSDNVDVELSKENQLEMKARLSAEG